MSLHHDAWWDAFNGGTFESFMKILAQGVVLSGPGPVQQAGASHYRDAELHTDRESVNADCLWGLAHFPDGVIPWTLNEWLYGQSLRSMVRPNYEATRLGQLRKQGAAFARPLQGGEYYGHIYRPTQFVTLITPNGRHSAKHWISDLGWVVLGELIANGIYPPVRRVRVIRRRKAA